MEKLDLALIEAVNNNETEKAISLLEQGANPNFCEEFISRGYINAKWFPLQIACRCTDKNGRGIDFFDNPELVTALLDFGAKVDSRNQDNFTALRWASVEPKFESAKVLIKRGADVNATDMQGSTPLIVASSGRNKEFISFLIENGANINHQNNWGATALMHSLNFIHIEGQIETVKTLLESGADTEIKDEKGNSLMYFLSHRTEMPRVQEAIELLSEYGFKE